MKPRLLLLEDDPTSRMFLATALAGLPVETDLAGSLAEARPLAIGRGHALWLFDANLPDGTGSGLLADLRRQRLATPAIVHTASADPAERSRLLADGFSEVLVKPLSADAWREAVRVALEAATPLPVGESPAGYRPGGPPVWDDAAAISALGGSPENLAALRELFLSELRSTRDRVVAAARDGDGAALGDALHRLRASCGFVGAARLDAAGRALRDAPACQDRLREFIEAADATARQAPRSAPAADPVNR